MSEHAKFSPSGAKQWIACPASWRHNLATDEPQTSSAAAREGTIAHALAEFSLNSDVDPKALIGKGLKVEIDGTEELIKVEKEIAEGVAPYVEHCQTLAIMADRRMIEEQVFVPLNVHSKRQDDLLWGTADFIAISDGERIDVVDLKFGHLKVDPENNPQLAAYLLGALELAKDKPPKQAGLHIVQPRISKEPVVWEIDDVQAFVAEWQPRFEQAVMRCKEASLLTTPLPAHYCAGDHCRFCNAIITCETFARRMIEITSEELEVLSADPDEVPPPLLAKLAKLGERFKGKAVINHYYDELEAYLTRTIREGGHVPGLKVVPAQGRRKWRHSDKEMFVKLRGQGLKKADFCKESVITPTQAAKLIDNERFFETNSTRGEPKEKLVPLSDKRDPIDVQSEVSVILEPPRKQEDDERPKPKQPPTVDLIELGEQEERKEQEEQEDLLIL